MISWFYQRILTALMPLSAVRQAQQFGWDTWLSDVEADHDAFLPDELWAAHKNSAGTSPDAGGSTTHSPRVVRAADAEPAQAVSVGGPFKSDEVVIEELVAKYRAFLRACFRKTP